MDEDVEESSVFLCVNGNTHTNTNEGGPNRLEIERKYGTYVTFQKKVEADGRWTVTCTRQYFCRPLQPSAHPKPTVQWQPIISYTHTHHRLLTAVEGAALKALRDQEVGYQVISS